MSQENVEIVRRANEAFNRGDAEALYDLFAPDAEVRDLSNAPDQPSVATGRINLREAWVLWTAAFDQLRADIEEYTDEGDAVICNVRWHGQGKESGMLIDVHQFDLYELRGGKIVRGTLGFQSKREALEAAGLQE